MNDIILKIKSKTMSVMPRPPEGQEDDTAEFISDGTMTVRGNITRISYEESEVSGIPGCRTTLVITPGRVTMKRSGKMLKGDTLMDFEEGKRHCGLYETPFASLSMEVLTDKICTLREIDGITKKVTIEYSISIKGLLEARKILDIEVMRKN